VSERSLTSNTAPPRKDAAIETREKILRAALATVRAHGIAGATTRAIAAEAGIAEGSIYRHFSDKIDVFQTAVVEYLVPSYRDFMGDLPAKAGTTTPAVRLREVLRKTMAFYRDLIPTMAVLYSENALRDRYQAQLIEGRGPHRASEAVAAYLAGELSLGRLPSGIDPQAAAQMLLGACFQQVFFEQTIGKERLQLSERALIARMVQTLTGRGGAPTSE
jgi:AcrR family transcriptional regulator